ncbi:MAG: ABC transporter permease subunit [bacterium]
MLLWTLVKKEFLINVISLKFLLAFFICSTSFITVTYVLVYDYKERQKAYYLNLTFHDQEFKKYKNYEDLEWDGKSVGKPPTPLSIFAQGLEGEITSTVRITRYDYPFLKGGFRNNSLFPLLGKIDLAYLIAIVMTLLAILFTYNAISEEKENGTLKLMLSNPISRDKILLGKFIGGFLSVVTPYLVSFLVSLLIITAVGEIVLSKEEILRVSLFFLVSLLYISVFFMIGIFVSTRNFNSTNSLFTSLFIWIILVLIMPNLSILIGSYVVPTPEISEIQGKEDGIIIEGRDNWMKKIMEEANRVQAPPSFKFVEEKYNEMQIANVEKIEQLKRYYEGIKSHQLNVCQNILSWLSAAGAYNNIVTELCQTNFETQESFINSSRKYRVDFIRYIEELKGNNQKIILSEVPQFIFETRDIKESTIKVSLDIFILIAYFFFFFTGSYFSFLRFDVR